MTAPTYVTDRLSVAALNRLRWRLDVLRDTQTKLTMLGHSLDADAISELEWLCTHSADVAVPCLLCAREYGHIVEIDDQDRLVPRAGICGRCQSAVSREIDQLVIQV